MIKRLLDEVDLRVGYRTFLRGAADAPVRGGASWAYVLGTTTVVLFLVLLVTGIALAIFYSPSSTDAWASIVYIEREIPLGALLRAIHLHAHSALVITAFLHLVRVVLWGAYKAPREATHITGLILLVLITVFSLTGYLLPFDQNAFWATKVRMGIVGGAPVVGELQTRILLGGNDIGNLSLTRFYALHTMVLPLMFMALVALHLVFFRRHGATPRPKTSDADAERATERYWPKQAAFDGVAALIVIVLVLAVSSHHPAPLEAPADPAAAYIARPEWYFLFLFQLLKYFHGALDVVGKVVAPTVAMLFLAALPFLDRAPVRRLAARRGVLGVFAVGLLGMAVLASLAVRADARDPALAQQRVRAEREATRAKLIAKDGVPVEGATFMAANDPLIRGERVFWAECASCHPLEGVEPRKVKAPDLTSYRSKAWLRQVLRDPDSRRLFGATKVHGMKPLTEASEAELARLVEYLHALRGTPAPTAHAAGVEALLEKFECAKCHDFEDDYGLDGPALLDYGAERWVRNVVENAGADHLYGKPNTMPKFMGRLSGRDITAVVAFLMSLEDRSAVGLWPNVDEPAPTPRVVPTSTAAESGG